MDSVSGDRGPEPEQQLVGTTSSPPWWSFLVFHSASSSKRFLDPKTLGSIPDRFTNKRKAEADNCVKQDVNKKVRVDQLRIPVYETKTGDVLFARVDQSQAHLATYRWTLLRQKSQAGGLDLCYARTKIDGRIQRMHVYILGKKPGCSVDHVDRDGLNNTTENLRHVSASVQSQNRQLVANKTSQYRGVSTNGTPGRWVAAFQNQRTTFKDELCAAYCYDQMVTDMYHENATLNGVAKPANYDDMLVLPSRRRKDAENRHIQTLASGNFNVVLQFLKPILSRTFPTLEEARSFRDLEVQQHRERKQQESDGRPITRTTDGIACKTTKGQHVREILLDDEMWLKLREMSCNVNQTDDGYDVVSLYDQVQRKKVVLSKYIMNSFDPTTVVDHINGNPLDNRRANLRVVGFNLNMHNIAGRSSTSRFKGVRSRKTKWEANLTSNYKMNYLGMYDTEELAASAYNMKALEVYGTSARLNDVVTPEGYIWKSDRLVKEGSLASCVGVH
jgi:hypothetical protein